MNIKINGKKYNFDLNPSINDLIKEFDLEGKPIVVEHNGIIISKENYDNKINNNDNIEIVSFVGGG